jgi:hypothetical protein
MTLKSFVLIGNDQTPQEVEVDATHNLEALKVNVADIFKIADHSGIPLCFNHLHMPTLTFLRRLLPN